MNQKLNIAPEAFTHMERVIVANGLEVIINLPKEKIEKINAICNSFDNNPRELINVLHETQHALGYLSAEVQDLIASKLNLSVAHVYGVVTF